MWLFSHQTGRVGLRRSRSGWSEDAPQRAARPILPGDYARRLGAAENVGDLIMPITTEARLRCDLFTSRAQRSTLQAPQDIQVAHLELQNAPRTRCDWDPGRAFGPPGLLLGSRAPDVVRRNRPQSALSASLVRQFGCGRFVDLTLGGFSRGLDFAS